MTTSPKLVEEKSECCESCHVEYCSDEQCEECHTASTPTEKLPKGEECADCGRYLDGENCPAGGVHLMPTPQEQTKPRDEWEKEFFERFGANKIWVVPSRDNVETIFEIKSFISKTLTAQKAQWEAAQKIKDNEERIVHEQCEKQWKEAAESAEEEGREAEHERLVEMVEGVKSRFRCAACDGAKCEHTQCCQALSDILKNLTS